MHGEMERIWLATANSELRSEVLALKQKMERLLVAGDRLAIAGALYETGIPKYLLDEWEEARRD